VAVTNADDEGSRLLAPAASDFQLPFGLSEAADVRATATRPTRRGYRFLVNGVQWFELTVPGAHNVMNALAAVAAGLEVGLGLDEMAGRLAAFELPAMRLEVSQLGELVLINDCYNANPASMRSAVEVLVRGPWGGRRVAVLGDMCELGERSAECHRALGRHAAAAGVDRLVGVGPASRDCVGGFREQARGDQLAGWIGNAREAVAKMPALLRAGDVVLVKGSRAVGLEVVAGAVSDWAASRPTAGKVTAPV
jgi:UDP-N-acetylmuramoyl-tripeptide--D-alanyl-D-alanine ligase